GFTMEGTPLVKRIVIGAAIVVALVLTGWGMAHDAMNLLAGRLEGAWHLISDVADATAFSLVAPIALIAWSFRGGRLFWPYAYLTACSLSWLLFALSESLGAPLGIAAAERLALVDFFRTLACTLNLAAALAQRLALAPGVGAADRS